MFTMVTSYSEGIFELHSLGSGALKNLPCDSRKNHNYAWTCFCEADYVVTFCVSTGGKHWSLLYGLEQKFVVCSKRTFECLQCSSVRREAICKIFISCFRFSSDRRLQVIDWLSDQSLEFSSDTSQTIKKIPLIKRVVNALFQHSFRL